MAMLCSHANSTNLCGVCRLGSLTGQQQPAPPATCNPPQLQPLP